MEGLGGWVPANPNSANQRLICNNWQENRHFVEPNLVGFERCTVMSGPGRLPTTILQQGAPACYGSASFVDVSGSGSSSSNWVTNGTYDLCTNLSFGKLLALAHGEGNTGGNQFNMISFANPSTLQYQESHQQGQVCGAQFGMMNNVLTDGSGSASALSRPLFDLNAPPMVMDAAQFEPVTPMKIVVNKDEAPAGGDRTKNKTSKNDEHHGKKEKSKLISNLMSSESTRLREETHKLDKRGIDEEEDLIRTPPPRMRRKKHRPKVIIEGQQQKRTPKSSVAKPNVVSQEVTKFKRKYVRKKGIDKVLEGGDNLDNTISKRKYIRGKGVNTPDGIMEYGAFETSDGGPARYTRSSSRRSLNFNLEGPVKDGSSMYSSSLTYNERSDEENINTEDQSRTVIAVEESDRDSDSTDGRHHTANQEPRVSMESSWPSFLAPPNMYPQMHSMLADQISHPRGKCQIVFSDAAHDKEIETVHIGMPSEDKRSQDHSDDYIFNGMCLTKETLYVAETVEPEVCTKYKTRTLHNYGPGYSSTFSQNADKDNSNFILNFPKLCKKMRSTMRHQAAKLQYKVTITGHRAKLEMRSATDGTQSEEQIFEDRFIWGSLHRIKKGRSRGRKRLRDLSSLLEIHKEIPSPQYRATKKSRKVRSMEILHEPQRCMNALVAMSTKKRSQRPMLINAAVQYNHQELSTISMGPPLALTWKRMPSIDSIIDQLNHLNLDHNLVTEYNAIVPYERNGDIVPFDSTFDEERRLRPKVDLDDETTRVWKLLLENINSEGVDGIDEENTKKWEDERRVFRGRADSFIARMRLVQGERQFSPWKGSVLDSVVGVFLTQNVSDHLSSSAFMSLVAQFPSSPKASPSDLHEEALDTKMKEPEIYDPDPVVTFGTNKETLNHSMHGEDTKMVHEYGSIKEIDHLGNFFNRSVSEDDLKGQPTESSKCIPAMYNEAVANKSESCIEDGRDSESTLSSQKSTDFTIEQTTEKSESCALSSTTEEPTPEAESSRFASSFEKLLQRAGSVLNGGYEREADKKSSDQNWLAQSESSSFNYQNLDHLDIATCHATLAAPSIKSSSCHASLGGQTTQHDFPHNSSIKSSREKELYTAEISGLSSESSLHVSLKITDDSFLEGPNFSVSNVQSINNDQVEINQMSQEPTHGLLQQEGLETEVPEVPIDPQNMKDVSNLEGSKTSQHLDANSNSDPDYQTEKTVDRSKARGRPRKGKEKKVKWNQLKTQALADAGERSRTVNTMDSVDWDAVRCSNVNEIAYIIKERGMNNMLAQRIKDFLNRLVRDHGSLDLEWLRDVPPDKAKEYLLSIRGLGLKSVECVRLLTLHHVAFPVDTNVGRIAVRLGWVPLQPLPESLQLHLLEMYPILETIQKYLWPRLCKLDQGTLYELHYQMITFGKVFCTKNKPNCNACPMRGECRHFASAFASARFALPAPEEKGIVSSTANRTAYQNPTRSIHTSLLPPPDINQIYIQSGAAQPFIEEPLSPPAPIIEVPTTPEPTYEQVSESIIESDFNEELDEIPTIKLNMEEFAHNLQEIIQQSTELHESDMSKALVALASEAASLPVPKLKNISRLRTEHRVYELPDSHPLLERMDKREPDDPSPYLLAIWTPGETVDSIEPPEKRCKSQGLEKLCTDEMCSSCNSIREANSQTVRGTLLIPCRTAMRGSFPLNGTYFQVNEVFSDHESSLSPLHVPRAMLWNLPRRTVFFGTSIPTIFRGLSTEGIQYCFWRGFVCVRGFDRKTRAPRPLVARLHFPASRLGRRKGKPDEEYQ